jgi:hypothetical protein
MLAESAVVGAIRAELYRVGGRPLPGGGQPSPYTAPSFPGGTPERLEWAMLPEKSARPLTEKFAEASVVAGVIMRTGRHDPDVPAPVVAAPEPAPVSGDASAPASAINGHAVPEVVSAPEPLPAIERTPEQIELSRLLVRQADLVSGPLTARDEAEYVKNGKRIAELSA